VKNYFSFHMRSAVKSSLWRSLLATIFFFALAVRADDAERIGLTAMRRERPAVLGTGILVAQPEGGDGVSWEVDPSVNPAVMYTWTSSSGTTNGYPNSVGSFS